MSGMCLRCHFNVPFAPGEDFCLDCYGDVEFEIEQALKEREQPTDMQTDSVDAVSASGFRSLSVSTEKGSE